MTLLRSVLNIVPRNGRVKTWIENQSRQNGRDSEERRMHRVNLIVLLQSGDIVPYLLQHMTMQSEFNIALRTLQHIPFC
jgi:hypothetical protein